MRQTVPVLAGSSMPLAPYYKGGYQGHATVHAAELTVSPAMVL
jgi:hypothetical protein